MNEPPKEMTLAKLDVLIMTNGEILCEGLTVGWVGTNMSKHLSYFKDAITGKPIEEKK
jgi:hypothetical protein